MALRPVKVWCKDGHFIKLDGKVRIGNVWYAFREYDHISKLYFKTNDTRWRTDTPHTLWENPDAYYTNMFPAPKYTPEETNEYDAAQYESEFKDWMERRTRFNDYHAEFYTVRNTILADPGRYATPLTNSHC
jgi:hypothetical protein